MLSTEKPKAKTNTTIANLQVATKKDLAPKVKDIDLKGEYPYSFMAQIGSLGGFAQTVPQEYGGVSGEVKTALQVIETVSETCLSTGFIGWCQIATAWYIQNGDNEYLKREALPDIATGKALAGTGLSNPMKHFTGIEKIALTATKTNGGYVVNGMLPWVSNLGKGHYLAIAAEIADSDDYLMAVVKEDFPGVTFKCNAHFIGLEGTGTYSCVFRDAFIPDEWVLAAPCEAYVNRIKPGFILTQVGMGLGLVKSCLDLINRSNKQLGHVNCFLDDCVEDIAQDLSIARFKAYDLADEIVNQQSQLDSDYLAAVIQSRLTASELSLRASQAAMLHAGARAYLEGSPQERKLREAYFVAIVTPAIKQLKKMLYVLSQKPLSQVGS
ncbi:Acyl-dehydrogenase [Hyella patelloides LEGE 07179]|uniref:Acyl-dehydrogenase n=1 Tax=Hyella patelloides LEGE 07179 TaxID=945734 RepID=A0A563VLS1_9CYAN|nr:acyl-CoA dehydrogenase family protein [Hyella patelloides]VEP12307.1 Acyl-dehydrogenase [Hyella patelloides LEGE 07179]